MLSRDNVAEEAKITSDIQEHLLMLYDLVLEINAKVVVELGAGRSTHVFIAAVNATEGQFYSIDVVPGRLALEHRHHPIVGDDLEVVKTWNLIPLVCRHAFTQNQLRELSLITPGTLTGLPSKNQDKAIDFLFIDTLHTYEQTKRELDTWSKFVRVGGIIAMHDTDGVAGAFPGCRTALDEFLGKHAEYSAVHYPNCNGLSVLRRL